MELCTWTLWAWRTSVQRPSEAIHCFGASILCAYISVCVDACVYTYASYTKARRNSKRTTDTISSALPKKARMNPRELY